MPISLANYPLLSPEQANPALYGLQQGQQYMQGLLQMPMLAAQAQYAPQLMQADVFGKEAAPLATIASNPYMWAMMTPQQQSGLTQSLGNLFKLLQGGSQNNRSYLSNTSMMEGGSPTNNGASSSKSNNYPSSNSSSSITSTSSSPGLLPGDGNIQGGARAKLTSPFESQPFGKGEVYYDVNTGKIVSSPSDSTIAVDQQALGSIQRVLPQLNRISDEGQEFLAPGGKTHLYESQIGNTLASFGVVQPKILDKFGIDREMPGRYEKFQSDTGLALEALKNSFSFPNSNDALNILSHTVQPGEGENDTEYKKRVLQTSIQLQNEQVPQLQNQLFSGIQYNPQNQATNSVGISGNNMQQKLSNAIQQSAQEFKGQILKFKGPDPRDGKVKIWNVPAGSAQQFIANGYARVG
jgi:hypothetical protein